MNDMSLKTQFEDSHYDPQREAIKRMYGKKMLLHTCDFIKETDARRPKRPPLYWQAKAFFGPFPDANFRFFAESAGFDAEAFHAGVMKLHDAPDAERKAAAKHMIAKMEAAE